MNIFDYKHIEFDLSRPYTEIPVNSIKLNNEGVDEFNRIYQYVKTEYKGYKYLVRTKAGYISRNNATPAWDLRHTKSLTELTLLTDDGMWRWIIRCTPKADKVMSGTKAFNTLNYFCQKICGIDLFDYSIDNGEEVKRTIPTYIIGAKDNEIYNKTFENVHHLDLNSSFLSGVAEAFPKVKPAIEHIFKERHNKPEYKSVLTNSQGYMQSKCIGFKLAHLSKTGIVSNNEKIRDLSNALEASGRKILLYNTDGIWYQGDIYHDENEGINLGQWKNDHINCIFRAKSKGAYEFIDRDGYQAIVRGQSKLDLIKPRTEWVWGDIYREEAGQIFEYVWTDKDGFVQIEGEV